MQNMSLFLFGHRFVFLFYRQVLVTIWVNQVLASHKLTLVWPKFEIEVRCVEGKNLRASHQSREFDFVIDLRFRVDDFSTRIIEGNVFIFFRRKKEDAGGFIGFDIVSRHVSLPYHITAYLVWRGPYEVVIICGDSRVHDFELGKDE
jgi:hypothetical protein